MSNETKNKASDGEVRPLDARVIARWHEGKWVKIIERQGLYYAMMDCANHPLNAEKSKMNLNAGSTFWRFPKYPFWVNSRSFATKPTQMQDDISTFDGFVELIGIGHREDYIAFCELWDSIDEDQKENLLRISKGL